MLIDTHCHLTDAAFDSDRTETLNRMAAAGVVAAVVIESDLERCETTLDWVSSASSLRMAAGCHPHDASKWGREAMVRLRDLWAAPAVAAVGEIGLDYHYDFSPRKAQRRAFAEQLDLAQELGLPVVIHAREADEDIVSILKDVQIPVILHSFSSGATLSSAGLEQDWYFSFSGMVTFKSWTLDPVVHAVRPDRLLVESDAPYLAPVPWRGRRNEPSFLTATAARLAEVRSVSPEELASQTTDNAKRLLFTDTIHRTPEVRAS